MRFEALKETLLKAGIAPRHVARYLRELTDHLADLTAAQREAGHDEEASRLRARALLGGDAELAAAMLAQPGFKSWPARAPWLVFGLLPPVAITALFMATVVPLVLISRIYGMDGHTVMHPAWFVSLTQAAALFANFALGPGLVALLIWTALRQRLGRKWPLLAAVLIALLGAHMTASFPQDGHRGTLSVGVVGVTHMLRATYMLRPSQFHLIPPESWPEFLIQFFLTLAPALWLLRDRMFARLWESR